MWLIASLCTERRNLLKFCNLFINVNSQTNKKGKINKFNIQHSSWPNHRSQNNKPETWNYKTALTQLHEIFGRVSLAVDSHTNQCSNRINERYFQRTKNYGPPNTFITQLIPGDIFNAAATSKRLEGTLINNSAFNF